MASLKVRLDSKPAFSLKTEEELQSKLLTQEIYCISVLLFSSKCVNESNTNDLLLNCVGIYVSPSL